MALPETRPERLVFILGRVIRATTDKDGVEVREVATIGATVDQLILSHMVASELRRQADLAVETLRRGDLSVQPMPTASGLCHPRAVPFQPLVITVAPLI